LRCLKSNIESLLYRISFMLSPLNGVLSPP
jgi:hypothetical protein